MNHKIKYILLYIIPYVPIIDRYLNVGLSVDFKIIDMYLPIQVSFDNV